MAARPTARPTARRLLVLAAFGTLAPLVAAPAVLRAQLSAATGLGALMQRQTNDPWQSTTRLDPTVRLDGRWLQMTGAATVLGNGGRGVRLDDGAVDAVAASPAIGAFRLTTTGAVHRESVSPLAQHTSGSIESALSLRGGSWGGWLGLAAEHTREIDSARVQPLLRLGVWRQFNNVTVTVSRESHSAFLTVPAQRPSRPATVNDSFPTSRTVPWSNVQARLDWSLRGVYFDTRFGMQPRVGSTPQATWGRGSATIGLSSRLSLVAEAGNQPASVWTGAPSRRFAALGLRVAPAALIHPAAPPNVRPNASTFTLAPVGHDGYVVSMRVPGARAVELSGDFNGWRPVALRETRPDVWEATLTLHPGTYHMNVRVNGDAWTAPPGLPAATDDFNGTVGLVVVH